MMSLYAATPIDLSRRFFAPATDGIEIPRKV
jgi:hypothetical protein